MNTLVLRTDLGQDPTFLELLQRTKKVTLEAYANQDVPFEKLVEELHPERDMGRTPFFQVMFAWQNTEHAKLSLTGLQVEQRTFSPNSAEDGTAKFDLALLLTETGGEIYGELEYSRDLFDSATIGAMVQLYTLLLEAVADDPGQHISEISLLVDREQGTSEDHFPAAAATETTLSELLSLRAQNTPEAPALISNGTVLNFGELNRLTDQFALCLQSQGVTAGSRVVICAEQTANRLIAALGVIKSGAIFVPVEPSPTHERELFILNDSGATWIATEARLKEHFPDHQERCILIDQPEEAAASANESASSRIINPEDIACVIYQSSASGRPLGVPVQYRALCGPVFGKELDIQSADTVALEISFNHEGTCLDAFAVLAAGACILEVPSQPPPPPRKFAMLLRDNAATILVTSAAVLQRQASDFPWALKGLRLIFLSDGPGELDRLRKNLKPEIADRIYGFYGSPETGGRKILYSLEMPFANTVRNFHLAQETRLFILDGNQKQVTAGIHGEICISSGNRAIHCTGDFGRWRKDGCLEFRGRRDRRMRIRGVRVHPEEIEMALLQHPDVGESVVVPRKHQGLRGQSLVALLTAAEDKLVQCEDLRTFLGERLPSALVPEVLTMVDAIPRTAEGQPDYRAILRGFESQEGGPPAYVAPRNESEKQIAEIWSETLNRGQIGIHDNFFHRGGHSLLATQLAARMSDAFHIEIPLRRIFETPTIAEMGKLVEHLLQTEVKHKLPRITPAPRNASALA